MNQLLSQPELHCLRSLSQAADELLIPIILVGASARWLVFNLPHGIPLHRTTKDWDFGVRVSDWNVFGKLRMKLIDQKDPFVRAEYEHRLIHKATGIKVDLIPFGELENDGTIHWPESAFEMNVFGFAEAYEKATKVDVAPGYSLTVATTPLLVALKFFAFSDRREETDRDLNDLWHVIKNYLTPNREAEVFDEPLSSITGDDFAWEYAPALLLGYDIGRSCSDQTVDKLLPILDSLQNPYTRDIDNLIGRSYSEEREAAERNRITSSFFWLAKGLDVAR